jgi:plastocyanin
LVARIVTRKTAVLAGALALVALLSACGSSSKSSSSTSSTTAASGATANAGNAPNTDGLATKAGLTGKVNFDSDPTNRVASPTSGSVDIELSNFYIGPTFINVKGGTTLHASLKNAGKVPHTFTIDSLNIDKTLDPGATATVDIKVPASGSLQFYCKFHRSLGMQGAILVTP